MNLFAAYPSGAPCLIDDSRTFTVEEVASLARTRAALVSSNGCAFRAPPEIEVVALAMGLFERGTAFSLLHPRWGDAEVLAGLATLGLSGLVDARDPGSLVASPSPEGGLSTVRDGVVLMTSGTSSRPKAVRLSRAALSSSVRASHSHLGVEPHDRWLSAMPIAHVGGLSIFLRALSAGLPVVVHRAFDPEKVLWSIANQGVTLLSVVPTMLRDLLACDRGELSRLRALLVGGASAPLAWLEACDARGIPALTTYGMTETASQVVTQPLGASWCRQPGIVGRALQGVELRTDESDRIFVRGPMLFDGYLGEPERSRDAWFATGDRGALHSDGSVSVFGRIDDLIISGGENVAPDEVEAALRAYPGILDALVFGVPDERWGQSVACALVVDGPLDLRAAIHAATSHLAPWKRPRRAVRVDTIPEGTLGKRSRGRAAKELTAELEVIESHA